MKSKIKPLDPFDSKISFVPFKKEVKKYNLSYLKDDLLASFSVALLAIPQAMAYSLLAGLPPIAGVYSAIFGAIFSGIFGSSKHLVAGPSTGVSILIQTTIANILYTDYPNVAASDKETLVLHILLHIVLLMGVLQIALAYFNMGKFLQFVSRSVILGYFAGVAVAIVINQLFYTLGIRLEGSASSVLFIAIELIKKIAMINWITLSMGVLSIVILVLLKKLFKRLPNALIMLAFMTALIFFLNSFISKDYLNVMVLKNLGMQSTPEIKLVLPTIDFKIIQKIFFPSLAIALLAILEVSSISKGVAAQSGQKIRANQQVFSTGLSNLILSFFYSSMPTSASISRTTLNYQSGAKTRFAAVYNGFIVAIIIFFFWPLIKYIPLCALSAILLVMVPSIIEVEQIKLCFKATFGDAVVFILTMVSCIIFQLNVAFFIGIVISIIFYLRSAAIPNLVEYTFDTSGRLMVLSRKRNVARNIRIIGLAGEMFFAAVDLVQNAISKTTKDPHVKVIILRLRGVYHVDASMCLAMLRLNDYLKSKGKYFIISGVTEEVYDIFFKTGVIEKIGQENIFLSDESKPQLSTWNANLRAEELCES